MNIYNGREEDDFSDDGPDSYDDGSFNDDEGRDDRDYDDYDEIEEEE